ncbi:uncharacterized protein LOC120713750 [Panicum virgatum]|uniref:KIB1-4 beta-propeller domain-containing protein n=1 Tax=Panicum virgatum TaxID=38727 RepID=A0A8T0RHJ1_PANVG|nr:uncharacterized protein LOC120713750 [Panicum virgatum]KAG2585562.1 hypothetical protein PVAP13_6KG398200 [Panicum virgatum]
MASTSSTPAAVAAAASYFPPELIPEVASRLTSLQDFFALRNSCRAYRAALPLTPSNLASQAPLLLLLPHRDGASAELPALFHIGLRRRLRFRIPRTRQGDIILVFTLGCRVIICDDNPRDRSHPQLRMVHLLTGEETRLPGPAPVANLSRFVLSGDLLVTWSYFCNTIGFCRLGAAGWSVASIRGGYLLVGMICVKGTVYALASTGYHFYNPTYLLAAVKLSDSSSSVELEFLGEALSAQTLHLPVGTELGFKLAECRGEPILVVTMKINPGVYHVFRWKSGEAKWVRITSLDGCALFFAVPHFVGCLGPDHPGIRKDCIYVNNEGLWSEYSSVDGSFRRSDVVNPQGKILEGFSSSDWVFPSMC